MQTNNGLNYLPIVQIEDDPDDQHLIREALNAASIANPVRFFSEGQQVEGVV